MAYLRWSSSPWYAYGHVDGGDDDDVLVAWHGGGAKLNVQALRAIAGERVSAEQDAAEQAQIDAFHDAWPPR